MTDRTPEDGDARPGAEVEEDGTSQLHEEQDVGPGDPAATVPEPGTAASAPAPVIGLGAAVLLAVGAGTLVNLLAAILLQRGRGVAWSVRALVHLYDLGHWLAAGLVAVAAVAAWQRWPLGAAWPPPQV